MAIVGQGWAQLAAILILFVTPARAVPLTKSGYCTWAGKEPGAAYDRVSISQGDHLMIAVNDPVFRSWGNSIDNRVQLTANHEAHRVQIRGAWTDVVPGLSTLSAYLYADARRTLGGAKSVQLWKGRKLLVDVPFENMPTTRQLNACVPPPGRHSDSEEH